MEVSLKPLDTLFFRDGKPFARGDETWADSNFPPNPSVVYGAMRTALATVDGRNIPFDEISTKLDGEKFQIQGLYYVIKDNNYLPLPLDFVEIKSDNLKPKSKEKHQVHLLTIGKCRSVLSEQKSFLRYLLHPADFQQAEGLEGGLISESELKSYLNGNKTEAKALRLGDFLKTESKVGIGRDNDTRVAEEGLLYRVDLKRPDGIEMRVVSNAEGYSAADLDKAVVNLGGEMKLAHFQAISKRNGLDIKPEDIHLDSGRFKIYLSTPAIFTRSGWQPDLERLFGIKATLVAACVGKTQAIGGYNLRGKDRGPKPMLRAVPAGSVYYYETEESPEKIASLQGQSLSDVMSEQGFGVAYFGNFNLPQ
jgi:CRISPR-associated protein Cmr3